MKRVYRPTGHVIYEGPSLLDGMPIVCIATMKSRNEKTGDMVQTWILRSDISPMEANRTGQDYSICGECPSRGIPHARGKGVADERSCYVDLPKAPSNVWKTYKAGKYPRAIGHAAIAAVGRGRKVRIGAYGDGSAMPGYVTESLLSESAGHTAYSHQSGLAGSSYDPALYMVSADSLANAMLAWDAGARTFRVVADYAEMVPGREIMCPSESGVHCVACGLCNGTGKAPNAKSIAIRVHGAGAKHHAAGQ